MPTREPMDERWMRACLASAERGRGRVSPNPMVGAAVVKSGRLVAEGHHARYGGDHAEVIALRRAGRRAAGATLYVTLEPCAHQGKTPPCTEAVIRSGVRRVVVAMRDPHPLVDGRGLAELRRAGIDLSVGALGVEARALNEAYLFAIARGRPMVTLKAGMTLDGKIATASRHSKWITSKTSRREAHRLRAASDAILVGAGTVLRDDPRLTVRGAGGRGAAPTRIVLDSRLRIPPRARLLRGAGGRRGVQRPVIVYGAVEDLERRRALERAGALVIVVGEGPGGVDLRRALRDMARHGIQSLLVEGGAEVSWSFLRAGLADRLVWFVSPRIVGGRAAPSVIGGEGVKRLPGSIAVRGLRVRKVGPDLMITGDLRPRGRRR